MEEVVAAVPGATQGPAFLAPQTMAASPVQADQRPQRMYIPRVGLDTPVIEVFLEGSTWQVADYAAGYHHGSALPGTPGNTVMAGHAGLRGAVFRDLPNLTTGDEVVIDTGDWRYHYRVREIKNVWPTQVEVMDPTPTPTLTLITCTNWDTQRLVVVADLVDARPLS
jgi:sortase A